MDPRILDDSGHWLCPVSAQWHLDAPLDLRRDEVLSTLNATLYQID
jgi:hypothetical protein